MVSNVIYRKDAIKELKKYKDKQPSNPDHISIINDCIDIIKNLPEVSIKEEAKDMGYSLIKIVKREKLRPCICGRNKREHWYGYDYVVLKCGCGREARGKNEKEAIHNWNKMIENEGRCE